MRRHTDWVEAVAFHPFEDRLASGSWDRTIKLWDYELGVEVATLRSRSGEITDLAFDSTGHRLASAVQGFQGRDNVVRLWETWEGVTPQERIGVLSDRAVLHRAQDEVWRLLRMEGLTLREARSRIERSGEGEEKLPTDVRAAALEHWENLSADWYWFQMRAWGTAEKPGLPKAAYERELPWAEAALKIAPESDICILTAATLHYRLGVLDSDQHRTSDKDRLESLKIVLRMVEPATAIEGQCQPGVWALATLAHNALGHTTQSKQASLQMTKLLLRHRTSEHIDSIVY